MIDAMKSSHITTQRRVLLTPVEGTMVYEPLEVMSFDVSIRSPGLQEGLGQNIAFLEEIKRKMENHNPARRLSGSLLSFEPLVSFVSGKSRRLGSGVFAPAARIPADFA